MGILLVLPSADLGLSFEKIKNTKLKRDIILRKCPITAFFMNR